VDGGLMLKLLAWGAAGVGAFVVAFVLIFSGVVVPPSIISASAANSCGGTVSPAGYKLDSEQTTNAGIIIASVQAKGLIPRAAVIAITVALQESTLHNRANGDAAGPDSRGIFQQRASWGPESVRMDPAGAAGLFLAALMKVGSWDTRSLGPVAEEVQHSADLSGSWYAVHEAEATAIVASYKPAQACSVPVSGPLQAGNPLGPDCPHPPVSQGFGPSVLQGEPAVFGYAHFHTGMDLACPPNTPVREVGGPGIAHLYLSATGFGNSAVVEIQSQAGHSFVRYAHLAAFAPGVGNGTTVKVGDLLGWEGSTGYSTGPHLHFEVDKNSLNVANAVDPGGWLSL
jgi:murein DD-endopeptidase MepM/ murein hydrolase activator NlpD